MCLSVSAQTPTPTPTPQPNTLVGQFTNSGAESFAGAISGDGRFVVFESRGNLATENPRNADGNVEIFLFDFAQRRIFQITDTKSVLFDTGAAATSSNIRVEITNRRPTISNDGRWIAFSSNATSSTPTTANATNPGTFDGNCPSNGVCPTPTPTPFTPLPTPTPTPTPSPAPSPGPNILTDDANLEIWLYQIPAYSAADLRSGEELPVTNLSGGTFTAVTNTPPSRLPIPATTTTGAFIASDNHDASINDDGSVVAFASTRDLLTCVGNSFGLSEDNDEIFSYVRGGSAGCPNLSGQAQALGLRQITKTPRGTISSPIYNVVPTISGDGSRIVFSSSGENPVYNSTTMTNPTLGANPASSRNEEIFFADLSNGFATGGRQLTTTTPSSPGVLVNLFDLGKRMSRDGGYIAFDSYADLANENAGANYSTFALYLYDVNASQFKRVGPRSDADTNAPGGDVHHYPGFTEYTGPNGAATRLLLTTRQNIKPDGTIPATSADGLNDVTNRPVQIYSYTIPVTAASNFERLTKFPISVAFLASTQALPSNTKGRLAFNLALTEIGTGNSDLNSESYYLLRPDATNQSNAAFSFFTGASRLRIAATPTPTPSPTPTPTATPTPTPTPTPTGSPSPTPSPTPVTPSTVLGFGPGLLAIAAFDAPLSPAVTPRTAVGSLTRSFQLPIELSGVSVSINNVACGIQSVSSNEVYFVLPPALLTTASGTTVPVVINNNGVESRTVAVTVPARPDIFTSNPTPGPLGRARLTNVTNRVPIVEPFTVTTIRIRGGVRVATRLRLRLTGVGNVPATAFTIRIGSVTIPAGNVVTGAVPEAPGVYTVDFNLPSTLNMAGDQPIVVTVTAGTTGFDSRLDDTATRVFIL